MTAGLTSSRLLSMAEAALDLAKPSWRQWSPDMRQESKEEMMGVLLGAYSANPVGVRCGVAMSEAGHDEQSRPPQLTLTDIGPDGRRKYVGIGVRSLDDTTSM